MPFEAITIPAPCPACGARHGFSIHRLPFCGWYLLVSRCIDCGWMPHDTRDERQLITEWNSAAAAFSQRYKDTQ